MHLFVAHLERPGSCHFAAAADYARTSAKASYKFGASIQSLLIINKIQLAAKEHSELIHLMQFTPAAASESKIVPMSSASEIMLQNNRMEACHVARRASDDFSEAYGDSSLDAVAPFESDEIILGRRVGSGSFSDVYQVNQINLISHQSNKVLGVTIGDKYTADHTEKREATVNKVRNGVQYVVKSLKAKIEESEEKDSFLDSAHDVMQEAEMLAAFTHPNIIELHGIIASRHESFVDGPSAFFIILEKLDCTLADRIEEWKKQSSFNPSKSLRNLASSISSLDKGKVGNEGGSLMRRLKIANTLAGTMEYLHEKGVIFRDLKSDNIGFDFHGNLKLFDFGFAAFMPQNGDPYEELFEMSGAGTPRYSAHEVFFGLPYNLKADVYSFSVVLWEMLSLKKPFPKCKKQKEFEQALAKVDKVHDIDRSWPMPIQSLVRKGTSKFASNRPTMKEAHKALDDFINHGYKNNEVADAKSGRKQRSQSVVLSSGRSSNKKSIRRMSLKAGRSFRLFSDGTGDDSCTSEDFLDELVGGQ